MAEREAAAYASHCRDGQLQGEAFAFAATLVVALAGSPVYSYPATTSFSAITMPRRNSPKVIENLDDLSHIDVMVLDKRSGQRASAKKNRRNRHYEKQFIRNTLTHRAPMGEGAEHPDDLQP